MKKEQNKNDKIIENKYNKKVVFIVCICCIIIFIGLFIILRWNGDNWKNNEEKTQNDTKNAEYNYQIDLAKGDLYVDIMEKNYTNCYKCNKSS